MPLGEETYQEVLERAREAARVNATLSRAAIKRLFESVAEDLLSLSEEGRSEFRRERAERYRRRVLELLSRLEDGVVSGTRSATEATISDVIELHSGALTQLENATGGTVALASSLEGLNTEALAAVLARGGTAASLRTIARRNLSEAIPVIDRAINRAVLTGASSRQLTERLARVFLGHPDLLAESPGELRRLTPDQLRVLGLDADVAGLRTLYYDARRIAVSEINNSYRESNRLALDRSPVVSATRWSLSGRHPEVDACDVLAEQDLYGYGEGYYPPSGWPSAPHPFCACYHAGPPRLRSPSEWSSPKPLPPDPDVSRLDSVVAALADAEGWTENRRDRISLMVTDSLPTRVTSGVVKGAAIEGAEATAITMRWRRGERLGDLAKEFDLSRGQMRRVLNNEVGGRENFRALRELGAGTGEISDVPARLPDEDLPEVVDSTGEVTGTEPAEVTGVIEGDVPVPTVVRSGADIEVKVDEDFERGIKEHFEGSLDQQISELNEEYNKLAKSAPGGIFSNLPSQKHERIREISKKKRELIDRRNELKSKGEYPVLVNSLEGDRIRSSDSGATKSIQDTWAIGLKAFERMTHPKYRAQTRNRGVSVKYSRKARAYFLNNRVFLNSNHRPKTTIHELGHFLEKNSEDVRKAARSFFVRRTKDLRREPLKGPGYKNEYSIPDDFFSAYVGKEYGDGTQEVISMGFEAMYKHPLKFFEEDREHFALIWAIMTGAI